MIHCGPIHAISQDAVTRERPVITARRVALSSLNLETVATVAFP